MVRSQGIRCIAAAISLLRSGFLIALIKFTPSHFALPSCQIKNCRQVKIARMTVNSDGSVSLLRSSVNA